MPASSVTLAKCAAYSACSAGKRMMVAYQSLYQFSVDSKERCTWASINPGSKVASPRSMTCAPSGILLSLPTDWILPSTTTTKPCCTSVPDAESNSRSALSTMDWAEAVETKAASMASANTRPRDLNIDFMVGP